MPVVFTAILFNIPKFFEAKTVPDKDDTLKIDTTDLRENPYYSIYYNTLGRGAALSFLPSVFLILLNYKIYKAMKSHPDVVNQETIRGREFQIKRRKQENNLAVLMLMISGVFVICHLLRNFLNIYEITVIQRNEKCEAAGKHTFTRWSLIVTSFSNLLLVFNSSTNMILYCIMNKKFRTQFLCIIKSMASLNWCRKPKITCAGARNQEESEQIDVQIRITAETAV